MLPINIERQGPSANGSTLSGCMITVIVLATGPALFLAGVANLASDPVEYRPGVSTYSAILSTWNSNPVINPWSNVTFSINLDSYPRFITNLDLRVINSLDEIRDGLISPTWSRRFEGVNDTFPILEVPGWSPLRLKSHNYQSFIIYRNGVATQTFGLNTLITELTGVCNYNYDSCSCQGYLDPSSRSCYRFWKVKSLCLVVDPVTGKLDSSDDGPGCAVPEKEAPASTGYTGLNSNSNLATVLFSSLGSELPNGADPVRFEEVSLTLRSSTDPYVAFLRLTKGTKSFGPQQQKSADLGNGLLATGIVISAFVGFAFCFAVWRINTTVEDWGRGPIPCSKFFSAPRALYVQPEVELSQQSQMDS